MSKTIQRNAVSSAVEAVLVTNGFTHLIAVIDATVGLQGTASEAAVIEIRRKLECLEMTADTFQTLLEDVPAFLAFEKRAREYNGERMVAFSKFLSLPENLMHAAALEFKRTADGSKSLCDCEAFIVEDVGTIDSPKYVTRFSGTFNALQTCFMAYAKAEPANAWRDLYAANAKAAASALRDWYQGFLEDQAEAKREATKGTEQASGEDEAPKLPEDAPEWLSELWNAADSIRNTARNAWLMDAETAGKIIPPITAQIQDMARAVRQAISAAVEDSKAVA